MKIEIYTSKETGEIKRANGFTRNIENWEGFEKNIVAFNLNKNNSETVEIRDATAVEEYFAKELKDKYYLDRYFVNGLESSVEDILDYVRSIKDQIENSEK